MITSCRPGFKLKWWRLRWRLGECLHALADRVKYGRETGRRIAQYRKGK